ncbi:MAG: regulatory protein RecX [Kiritimatiellia bacterium]
MRRRVPWKRELTDVDYTVRSMQACAWVQGGYIVTCTGDLEFICPDEVCVRWSVKTGVTFINEDMATLLAEAELILAKQEAMRFLAISAKSAYQLRTALKQRGFSTQAITNAEERMLQLGYINDLVYARNAVAKMQGAGQRGIIAIKAALAGKGVPAAIIAQVLAQTDDEAERSKALALAEHKMASYKDAEPAASRRRLAGFLSRRGFSADIVNWCLARLFSDDDSMDAFS